MGSHYDEDERARADDLTIFKVHFGRLTVKLYTKGECVLRAEAIAHNTAELRCGRVLEKFPQVVGKLCELLHRFLEALRCIDVAWISDRTLEERPAPSTVGKTRVGGVDINKPRMRAVMEAVVALSVAPGGFSAAMLAEKVREFLGQIGGYAPRHGAYDLKKLRGKELVRKTTDKSRRYEPTPDGLRAMAGLVVLRRKWSSHCSHTAGAASLGARPAPPPPLRLNTRPSNARCSACSNSSALRPESCGKMLSIRFRKGANGELSFRRAAGCGR